jgi:hypothetical protein
LQEELENEIGGSRVIIGKYGKIWMNSNTSPAMRSKEILFHESDDKDFKTKQAYAIK